jgi:type II secretory pathway component PulF
MTDNKDNSSNAMALFGVRRGIETGQQISEAFNQQSLAQLNSDSLRMKLKEIERRATEFSRDTSERADKTVSYQQAAFTQAGVKLTGSSLSVMSDTLNKAARESFLRQREMDYESATIATKKAAYDRMASNETLFLSLATAGVSGYANLKMDEFQYNRASMRNRGPSGLGEG